jgi:hypothetical protein
VFVRVVRFTDVDPDRVESTLARIEQSDGPPPGVTAKGLQILLDREQNTAVVMQLFETAEDMASSEQVFDSMDSGDTPGTRASVDRCEEMLSLEMWSPPAG